MKEVTKEEYLVAKEIVDKYYRQEREKRQVEIDKCNHNWVLDEGWAGHLEGDTHCSICGTSNPGNWN
jgi:hypothetical protein